MSASVDLLIFKTRHFAALELDQPRFSLMIGLLNLAEAKGEKTRFWSLAEGARCALHPPPHFIGLPQTVQVLDRTPIYPGSAMATISRETSQGANISLVFTPPRFRGRAYVRSAAAFAAEEISKSGKGIVFLYVDARNPSQQ